MPSVLEISINILVAIADARTFTRLFAKRIVQINCSLSFVRIQLRVYLKKILRRLAQTAWGSPPQMRTSYKSVCGAESIVSIRGILQARDVAPFFPARRCGRCDTGRGACPDGAALIRRDVCGVYGISKYF